MTQYNYDEPKITGVRLFKFILMVILTIAISLLFLSIGIDLYSESNHQPGIVIITIGLLSLIVGGIYLRLYNQQTLTDVGYRDNKTTFRQYKAGYYSFVGSLYIMIYMLILVELNLNVRFVFYLGISLSLILFVILYSLFNNHDISLNSLSSTN